MLSHRFWIERALEDCEGELGMADSLVRKYISWNHHQALFYLAMDSNRSRPTTKTHPSVLRSGCKNADDCPLEARWVSMEKEVINLLKPHTQRNKDILIHYPQNDYF